MKAKLFVVGLWAGLLVFQSNQASGAPSGSALVMGKHGLADQAPTDLLPQNAIAHLQINRLETILENLETMAVSTVPEKLLPPDLQDLFSMEHPVLTMLGQQFLQAPLTADSVAQRTGLAIDQPAGVTLYPGNPMQSFVLSLPVADYAVLEEFLRQVCPIDSIQPAPVGSKKMVRVKFNHPRVQEVYLASSPTHAYISGQASLLMLLYEPDSYPRLSEDEPFHQTQMETSPESIWFHLNPDLIKPFLSQVEFFKYVPLNLLLQQRESLLNEIPENERRIIEDRLRVQLGVSSLEELADYIECFLTATYEEVFDLVLDGVKAFNGCSLALDFHEAFPRASVYLYSDKFQPENRARALPMETVRTVLGRLPGSHDHLRAGGRRPPAEPSPRVLSWFERVLTALENKELDTRFMEGVARAYREMSRPQSIPARVPWHLKTRLLVESPPAAREYQSLKAYCEDLLASWHQPWHREVTVVPDVGDDFLEEVWRDEQHALAHNTKLWNDVFQPGHEKFSFFVKSYRLHSEEHQSDVSELTWETVFTTRSGFFGFNEHEFISRRIYYSRPVEDYLLFHQASTDDRWIRQVQLRSSPDLPAGLPRLLNRIPEDANTFAVHRALNAFPVALNWLQDLEELVHRDIDLYLAEVREKASAQPDAELSSASFREIPFPALAYSLNRDSDTGDFYCLLPGGLVYPRPQVVPLVTRLFRDFKERADQLGGLVCYSRVTPGRCECTVMQNTEALSFLVKSLGNAVYDHYLSQPSKLEQAQQLVVREDDFNPAVREEIVLRNPDWAFMASLEQWPESRRPEVKRSAHPQHPIPERKAQVPDRLIDLSDHYNAALEDTWHAGGLPDNDLGNLPHGTQTMAGTPFDVRGIVQLSGRQLEQQSYLIYPPEITGIEIQQTAGQIHFLHATGWPESDGTRIGTYRVHYQDSMTEEIPIIYGEHLRDWWTPADQPEVGESKVAWQGTNPASSVSQVNLQLYKTTWQNPRPEVPIESLDYLSTMSDSAPFLIAVTVE